MGFSAQLYVMGSPSLVVEMASSPLTLASEVQPTANRSILWGHLLNPSQPAPVATGHRGG